VFDDISPTVEGFVDAFEYLKRLAVIDIVEFEDGGQNGAMQPIVPYDRIEMHIDYPLVDDDADTETAMNAEWAVVRTVLGSADEQPECLGAWPRGGLLDYQLLEVTAGFSP